MIYDQAEFGVRCEWGMQGVAQLAPISDVIIIVDVLSFSTCVDIAVARGAIVYPYRFHDASAETFAASVSAELAGKRGSDAAFSLSPASLLEIPHGTRLVLASPNGATLTLGTATTPTLAGCLRNAHAVAHAAQRIGTRIAVIPAGERWADGSLRPALEDWLGAGAVLDALVGSFSPEAHAARLVYKSMQAALATSLRECSSGKELLALGFARDVELAAMLNVSETVPRLENGAYRA